MLLFQVESLLMTDLILINGEGRQGRLMQGDRAGGGDGATRFSTSGFLHGSVSPKPVIILLGRLEFCRKFAEIFAAQDAPQVSLTPVANGKNLQSQKCSLFLLDTFGF
jgi:hypothetical protein